MFKSRARIVLTTLLVSFCVLICCVSARAADEIPIRSGQKLAFLGDSITAAGAASPSGYVRLVISGLGANGVDVTAIPAGISGHTSRDMLARIDRDVIEKKPDWMTMSCGVNDVWHGATGVDLPTYKKNITEMVDRVQKAGIKVMILTSTMIGEDQSNANNKKLIAYNDFLRDVAKEKGCLLADLNADMQAAVAAAGGGKPGAPNTLTKDGVHMIVPGDRMMALGILKAFGLDDAQLEKARQAWPQTPPLELSGKIAITPRQWDQLNAIAAREHKTVADVVNEAFSKSIEAITERANEPAGGK